MNLRLSRSVLSITTLQSKFHYHYYAECNPVVYCYFHYSTVTLVPPSLQWMSGVVATDPLNREIQSTGAKC